ncbi:MAG: hypothetical protein HeimC2_02700 [Candidatus Heimdallarchaeota archaeon LC_2]|nr:MAG: hypothetical protein HeimC2_02700 [Candidatus Heimdallarchaeota archaeon LC_2]
MVFGDDLRGELGNRIGVSESGDTLSQLQEGRKEKDQGNLDKANQIFNAIIDKTNQSTTQLLSQKQHRAAAEEFYYQALSYEFMEKVDERRISLSKTVDALQNASHTALNFGEDKRGITTLTLAGLVALTYGDDTTANAIYKQGEAICERKENTEGLKKLLFSLGYLLDAKENNNMAALTDAQGYISSDLKPMLNNSKLTTFNPLLETIVNRVGASVEASVKMPKIEVTTQLPGDLLLNTQYELKILVENKGDGEATNLQVDLSFPSDLELISGEISKNFGNVAGLSEIATQLSFKMGGELNVKKEISGTITFTDMLQNNHKKLISPIDLDFRSVSKGSEYNQRIENVSTGLLVEGLHEELPVSIIESVKTLNGKIKEFIVTSVDNQEFSLADEGLNIYREVINWSNDFMKGNTPEPRVVVEINKIQYRKETELTEKLTKQFGEDKEKAINEKVDQIRRDFDLEKQRIVDEKNFELEHQIKESDAKFKEKTSKMISDHNNSIQDLKSKSEYEKEQAIGEATVQLKQDFETEKQQIKLDHETEIGKLTRTQDNKVRLEITQLESKLKEEANVEIQKKNVEVENAIRELQTQNISELEAQADRLRKELTLKYTTDIEELKGQLQTQEDRLVGHAVEEKESALRALKNKLEQEKDVENENMKRELKDGYDFDVSEQVSKAKTQFEITIQNKDMEIKELKEKIEIIKSRTSE